MLSKKSPSGAMFPYYYKNGELFGVHLGSYEDREDDLIAMMKAEEAFFLGEHLSLGMWLDLYEDRLTDRVLHQLTGMICRIQPRVTRLALVGVSFWDRRRINRLLKEAGVTPPLPVRFYSDPEEAKTWLVGKSR